MIKKENTIVLVSFATRHFKMRQRALNISALKYGGFTEVKPWNFKKIKQTSFYHQNHKILNQKRGAGYWLWKPYIILNELEKNNWGDFVVYSDCGRGRDFVLFTRSILPLLDMTVQEYSGVLPGIYIPQFGAGKIWTKRDCYILTDTDSKNFWEHCHIQASFSIWQKSELSISLLEQWLYYSQDERILTDIPNTCGFPNLSGFRDHRHDQSVLTLCVLKNGLKGLGNPFGREPFCENDKNIDKVLEKIGVTSSDSFTRSVFIKFVSLIWYYLNVARNFSHLA